MNKMKKVRVGLVIWIALVMTCLTGMTSGASYATTNMKYYRDKKVYGSAFRPGNQEYVYSRIVLPYDGTIAVSGIRTTTKGVNGTIDAILCNSSMQPIDVYGHAFVRYDASNLVYQTYGVTKGTYYIRTTTKGRKGQRFQVFSWYKYRTGNAGGADKAHAFELKKEEPVTGVIAGSYYQYRWFKFNVGELKKPVKLRILFNGGQGQTNVYLAGPAFEETKKYEMKPVWRNPKSLTITLSTTIPDPKFPKDKKKAKVVGPSKGTYYVLVTKDAKDKRMRFSSGGFAIKWWY